jgi:hypothetical protein
MDHISGVPVLKVCDFRYCLWFAETDPAFKLNTGILGISRWFGLCINGNGLLLGLRLLF